MPRRARVSGALHAPEQGFQPPDDDAGRASGPRWGYRESRAIRCAWPPFSPDSCARSSWPSVSPGPGPAGRPVVPPRAHR